MDYEQKDSRSILISILVIFLISALVMFRQLLSKGYFSCHAEDTYAYVSWAWQFVEALKEGIIYPRWLPVNYWGYGGPMFILLPPLAFYLVAFFNMFTGSVIMAMNITKFMALFLSGVGMFFLVKEFYSEKVALFTAGFYAIFPYNIFQYYLVGTFASVVSFMWFAPIILFTYRYMKSNRYRDMLYSAICYAGLILTHLINAYMFTFVLGAFVIYMSIVTRRPKKLTGMFLIVLIGLLISSAYIMPVIFEKQFMNLKEFIGEGKGSGFLFDYHNFFILPDMTDKFSKGHLWNAYYDSFVFHVFIFCILVALSVSQMIRMKHFEVIKRAHYINTFFIGTVLCTMFLLFGISSFIWETIPLFKYIQFAHRWLNITAFSVVFLSAVIALDQNSHHRMKIKHSLFIVLLCVMCFLLDFKYIMWANVLNEQDLLPVKSANWYREHLPVWVDIEKIDKREDINRTVDIKEGVGKVDIVTWKSAERTMKIKALEPVTLRIRTFYFPGWKAYLDGVQMAIKTEKEVGAMIVNVPRGTHVLVLKFEDTPVRYYSKIISLVTMCVIVFIFLFPLKKTGISKK